MDINHYLSRLSVRRESIPKVWIQDDLSIHTVNKLASEKESQIGLTDKKFGYQKKLQNTRERYYANRKLRLDQIKEYRANNPEKVKLWQSKNNEKNKEYQKQWRKENSKKCTEYTKKCKAKKLEGMTPEQKKEHNRKLYENTRQRMIEKHGLQGWRDICTQRARQSRAKKNDKSIKS
jgi:hypothetical protein